MDITASPKWPLLLCLNIVFASSPKIVAQSSSFSLIRAAGDPCRPACESNSTYQVTSGIGLLHAVMVAFLLRGNDCNRKISRDPDLQQSHSSIDEACNQARRLVSWLRNHCHVSEPTGCQHTGLLMLMEVYRLLWEACGAPDSANALSGLSPVDSIMISGSALMLRYF